MKIPSIVFYTEKFMPEWVGARAIGPIVLIRPKYRNDKGIHAHENTHVNQWAKWAVLWVLLVSIALLALPEFSSYITPLYSLAIAEWPLLYKFNTSFRLEQELEAYTNQINAGADLIEIAQRMAHPEYGFGLTRQQAFDLLLQRLSDKIGA